MLDEFVVVKSWYVEDNFVCMTLICSMINNVVITRLIPLSRNILQTDLHTFS